MYNQAAAFSNHIPVRAAFYVEVSSVLKILPMVSMSYLAVMPTTDLGMAKFHSVRNCQKACSLISRCGEGLALNYVLNDLKFFVHLWMHTKLHSACATKWKSLMKIFDPDDDSLEQHINFLAYI